jgi:hypothetical protein
MTSLHSGLTGTNLHEAFHYVQTSDPGAVGAGKYWLDTTASPYVLKRRNSGNSAWVTVGASGGGGTAYPFATYHPDIPPTSPTFADEFNAASISGSWTAFGSPTGSTSDFPGYLRLRKTSSGVEAGYYAAFAPGAAAFSVACKMSYQVFKAASNQAFIGVRDSGGANIVSVGAIGNSNQIITKAAALGGGFATDGALTYITGNMGTIYFLITRDATTNYNVYASHDGITWWLARSFSQAGTVARLYLGVEPQSATEVEANYDWVRAMPSATFLMGNTP